MSSGTALAVGLSVAGGIAGAVQAAVMGRFGERIGTVEAFAFATMLTALIAAIILLLASQSLDGYAEGARAAPWLWSAGAMGALIVLGITFAAPRIGTAATIGILTAGNLGTAAVIDRFGLFGLDRIAITWPRAVGLVLLAAGAALILKR